MSGKVEVEIIEGPMKGKKFAFEEHDTFLFGRLPDCHACLPHDSMVSRNHFIMEVNPPDACMRDLGSLNGTYVNGVKYGGRERGETPEEAAGREYPAVKLNDGDQIKVGASLLAVHVEVPMVCAECGREIGPNDLRTGDWALDQIVCIPCRKKAQAVQAKQPEAGVCADCKREVGPGKAKLAGQHGKNVYCDFCWDIGYQSMQPAKDRIGKKKTPEPVRCQKCGKDVSKEVGRVRRGAYVCESCRKKDEADPAKILLELLRKAGKLPGTGPTPDIEGYKIERQLGVGGFGAVYLARDKKHNRSVAIKVMLSKVAVDERAKAMFLREIAEMKKLKHKNIVSFLDCGSAGGAFYVIMDYCDGGGVDRIMRRRGGKLSPTEGLPIMLQALEGLGYVHNRDIVHRDLKPANILLTGDEGNWTAKVADLGLAKNFQKAGLSGMTVTGTYAGTPHFTPREQLTNFKYVKPVSDVWSMAATFYNMLTGYAPRNFPRGKDPVEIVLRGKVIPIRDRDSSIPKNLAKVIDRALDDKARNRYQTADEFRKALKKTI